MNSSLRFYTVLLKKLHLILSKLGKFRGPFFGPPCIYTVISHLLTAASTHAHTITKIQKTHKIEDIQKLLKQYKNYFFKLQKHMK